MKPEYLVIDVDGVMTTGHFIYDDPVNSKGNLLYKFAKKNKIEYVSGLESSYYQGVKQFEICNNAKVNKKNLNILRLSKFRFFS